MSFNITSKVEGTRLAVLIAGSIDEDSNFTPPDFGSMMEVVIDLGEVSAINSVGIREWIKWINTFPASLKTSVRRCPKVIVDQINMVAGFLPAGTTIESFYVPYYSDASGAEKMVLFSKGQEYSGDGLNIPAEVKDENGEVMEMDVIEAKYFKFLKNA